MLSLSFPFKFLLKICPVILLTYMLPPHSASPFFIHEVLICHIVFLFIMCLTMGLVPICNGPVFGMYFTILPV